MLCAYSPIARIARKRAMDISAETLEILEQLFERAKRICLQKGLTEQEVQLTNLPAGVYTVRAREESGTRWLRTEGKIVTEVPWIFAVPTGANKVTVYWDGVPGATGYRVRWGTVSGSYPSASEVLSGSVRRYTVSGLMSEQEHYFVVEAEWHGVWGPPSEEDSAVPHVGAIRWDSGNVSWIMEDVRRVIGSMAGYDVLDVLGPDGLIYTDSGVRQPTTFFDTNRQVFLFTDFPSLQVPAVDAGREELENTCTGPYRRVRTRGDRGITAVRGTFWVPSTTSPHWPFIQISIPPVVDDPNNNFRTADTPYMYFGFAFGNTDVEGGLMYHRAGRAGLDYPRWQAYMKVVHRGRVRNVAITDTSNMRGHILDNVYGGTPTVVELYTFSRDRAAMLRIQPIDPKYGNTIFLREIFATAKLRQNISGARFRRVFSIAQRRESMPGCPLMPGCVRTGSYVSGMGIGYNPIEGSPLDPPGQISTAPFLWFEWIRRDYTDQAGSYPGSNAGIVSWVEIIQDSREAVTIYLGN